MSTQSKENRRKKSLYVIVGRILPSKSEYDATIKTIVDDTRARRELIHKLATAKTRKVRREVKHYIDDIDLQVRAKMLELRPLNHLAI